MYDSEFLENCKYFEDYIECEKRDIREIEEKINVSKDPKEIEALTHLVDHMKRYLPEHEKRLERAYKEGSFNWMWEED